MTLVELMAAVATLAAVLVLPCTQLIKDAVKLDGWWVLALSVGVGIVSGALLAGGGVVELRALTLYPPWASGAVLGLLAGLAASGGKAVATSVQKTGAWAQAEARAKVEGSSSGDEKTEEESTSADGWEAASLDDLGRTRTDWPTVAGVMPDEDPPLARQ